MPTNKPRLIVTLEPALYAKVKSVARANGTGLSAAARDLIREACEDIEDFGLAVIGSRRIKSLKKAQLLTHEQAWSKAL
jgi:predicted DNA-binding protein